MEVQDQTKDEHYALLRKDSFSETISPCKLKKRTKQLFHGQQITNIDAARTDRTPCFLGTSAYFPLGGVNV